MPTFFACEGLSWRERQRFAAICDRHGRRAAEFEVILDHFHSGGDFPLYRQVIVIALRAWHTRRYRSDPPIDWLNAFEDDLRHGWFDRWQEAGSRNSSIQTIFFNYLKEPR